MEIPNPKSQAPNPKRALALGFGIWALGFGFCAPAPANAQRAYVAGAIGADISRVSHTESNLGSSPSSGSEVLEGGLRVGTSVGSNWGVELGFDRSGLSKENGPGIFPLAAAGGLAGTIPPASFTFDQLLALGLVPGNLAIPVPITFQSDVRTRHSSLDAAAWARQSLGGKLDLVYLGGVAFSRDRSDVTQRFSSALGSIVPLTFSSTSIAYATRPLVGMEARIAFTSRVRLMPGLRVQGLGDGWLVRPYVGLGWFF